MDNYLLMDEPTIDTPRTIAALYFALLSIIATAFIQFMLHSLNFGGRVPIFLSFVLAIPIAALFGALYGKAIIYSPPPYKLRCFLLGIAMTITALPIYDIGLLFLLKDHHSEIYKIGHAIKDYFVIYLFILIYSFILIGSWLSVACGLACIYLRHKFIPNLERFVNELEEVEKKAQK
jgi:hypothetical protein